MTKSSLVLYSEESKTAVYEFTIMFLKFSAIILFLVVNLTAVSLALLCHQNDPFISKVFIALFAFMFGFIYIIFNYYTYRVLMKGEVCTYNGQVFPF
jgi:hypothetical protein